MQALNVLAPSLLVFLFPQTASNQLIDLLDSTSFFLFVLFASCSSLVG